MKTDGLESLLFTPAVPRRYEISQKIAFGGLQTVKDQAVRRAASLTRKDGYTLSQLYAEEATGKFLQQREADNVLAGEGIPGWMPFIATRISNREDAPAVFAELLGKLTPETNLAALARVMTAERFSVHPFRNVIKGPGSKGINDTRQALSKALFTADQERITEALSIASMLNVNQNNKRRRALDILLMASNCDMNQAAIMSSVHGFAEAPGGMRAWELSMLERAVRNSRQR